MKSLITPSTHTQKTNVAFAMSTTMQMMKQKQTYKKNMTLIYCNKDLVREMTENHKKKTEYEDKFCCLLFDFQRVLPCPKGDTSLLYYKKNCQSMT